MVMVDKNAIDVQMFNPDDDADSTLNNMTTTSELLDTSIEEIINKKKTIALTIDSVISLMNKVEYEEEAAEQAKEEAAWGHSSIMLKANGLMHMQQNLKKRNGMLAREACEQKKLIAAKMEALQFHVTRLLDKGDRSLELLDEMSSSLDMRLNSALMEKNLAIKKKKENEAFARAALAYQETQMTKLENEYERLKQEAMEISKFQEFLRDHDDLVTTLRGEISNKCQDVKRLKKELDQVVFPGEKMSSCRKSSISSSSLVSSIIPCQPQPEPADSDVLLKKGDFIDDHVHSASKQIKSVIEFSEADTEKQHGVADIARSIKNVRIRGKLHANQMFVKCIKKVKIKGKLHGHRMSVKSIKKIKIKSKLLGNQMRGKRIKKLKIKCKRHGNQMRAKSIKNLKMQDNRHGSQIRAKIIKKVKIKNKLNGSQLCPKSNKKVNINGKQQGCQMCAISIKKVKIKGLQVV